MYVCMDVCLSVCLSVCGSVGLSVASLSSCLCFVFICITASVGFQLVLFVLSVVLKYFCLLCCLAGCAIDGRGGEAVKGRKV